MSSAADTGAAVAATEATPKKVKATSKAGAGKKKGAAKTATHPPTGKMVVSAITSLKERGGSSVKAIKKYISSTYKVDADKLAPFIKRYLKSAVADKTLIQTKGKGASGSFKLAVKGEAAGGGKTVKKSKKPKSAARSGSATPKKAAAAAKKPKAKKSPGAASKIKKKATKTPTKPKVPKPKKAVAAKKGTTVKKSPKPKKAAAKKGAAKK